MTKRSSFSKAMLRSANLMESFVKSMSNAVFPVKKKKRQWCQCDKCKGWHFKAK